MSSPAALGPVTEVTEFLARAPSREAMAAFQLSPTAHERLQVLLARNAAGTLIEAEARELDQMIVLDDILSLLKARARIPRRRGITVATITAAPRRAVVVRAAP